LGVLVARQRGNLRVDSIAEPTKKKWGRLVVSGKHGIFRDIVIAWTLPRPSFTFLVLSFRSKLQLVAGT